MVAGRRAIPYGNDERADDDSTSDSTIKTRLDPIVSPGKVSGHVHIFMGSSKVLADLDHENAAGSQVGTSVARKGVVCGGS